MKEANNEKELKELIKEKRFRICPVCDNLLQKDNKCDKIECPECKTSLCFDCACLRDPMMGHDNSFHREECHYFSGMREPENL